MGPIKPWSKVAALISGLPALPQNEAGELRAMTAMVAIWCCLMPWGHVQFCISQSATSVRCDSQVVLSGVRRVSTTQDNWKIPSNAHIKYVEAAGRSNSVYAFEMGTVLGCISLLQEKKAEEEVQLDALAGGCDCCTVVCIGGRVEASRKRNEGALSFLQAGELFTYDIYRCIYAVQYFQHYILWKDVGRCSSRICQKVRHWCFQASPSREAW